jgi:Pentapeptide repeats (8 copies)
MIAWFVNLPWIEKVGWFVLGLILLGVLFVALYLGLRTLNKITDNKDRVGLKIEIFKTVASILGGLFFLATLYFTWQNLAVTQEKNTTDLYTKAIDQLGGKTLEVRLGGIYALERIAQDSEKYHEPIMEVLTAYIRANSPWPPEEIEEAQKKRPWAKKRLGEKPKEKGASALDKGQTEKLEEVPKLDGDIQAVLTVIGRRSSASEKGKDQLYLTETDLRKAYLANAHLENAYLADAHLEEAILFKAHLEEAILNGAYLEGARLKEAHLEEAILNEAYLEGARLNGAYLKGAVLDGAHLEGADLSEATGLTQDQIDSAITVMIRPSCRRV